MKKLIIKNIDSNGDSVITAENEPELREKLKDDRSTVMVLPDGRVCHTVDELLSLIQEDVYQSSGTDNTVIYRLPILVGG